MSLENLKQFGRVLADLASDNPPSEAAPFLTPLEQFGEHLLFCLDAVGEGAVPPVLFTHVESGLQQVSGQVETFRSNRNPAHLSGAVSALPSAYQALGTLALFLPSVGAGNLIEAASTYRRSVGQLTRNMQDEGAALQGLLQAVEVEAEKEKARISASLAKVRMKADELAARIQADEARIDTAIQGLQTQFSSAQESHRSEFSGLIAASEKSLADALASIEKEASEASASQLESAGEVLTRLETMDAEISKVYEAIADKGVAGAYLREAAEQKADGDRWRWIAFGLGLMAVAVAVFVFVHASVSDVSVGVSLLKLSAGLAFAGVAAFAGTQAAQHRKRERNARDIQMQLVSLDPYLARLPTDQKNDLKRRLALRIFKGGDEPGSDGGWEAADSEAD